MRFAHIVEILSFDLAPDCKHITAYQSHNLHLLCRVFENLSKCIYTACSSFVLCWVLNHVLCIDLK